MIFGFYTYLHLKPNGEIFYVGKGCDKKGRGRRSHNFTKRSRFHKNIVEKYGKENISVYVFPCENEIQAFNDEIHQIAQLRKEGVILCNLTIGGDGSAGHIMSEESRNKMKKPKSKETRMKMSKA